MGSNNKATVVTEARAMAKGSDALSSRLAPIINNATAGRRNHRFMTIAQITRTPLPRTTLAILTRKLRGFEFSILKFYH